MRGSTDRTKQFAKAMRSRPTRAEDRIWRWLRGRRFRGYKFRRQVPLGRYIVDFFCAELMLAIEVDGRQHEDPRVSDADSTRSLALRAIGVEVVRVSNEQMIRDAGVVSDQLTWAVERRERTLGRQ